MQGQLVQDKLCTVMKPHAAANLHMPHHTHRAAPMLAQAARSGGHACSSSTCRGLTQHAVHVVWNAASGTTSVERDMWRSRCGTQQMCRRCEIQYVAQEAGMRAEGMVRAWCEHAGRVSESAHIKGEVVVVKAGGCEMVGKKPSFHAVQGASVPLACG
mmetsp:Transcript_3024/g.8234  ORF Transcript_3024/g.8234 Transcript_3024/m.8234 type:complete len:158 (+) Transcript_3024:1556-2029(+)